jgi:CelD/BcsL family acetyltransferase involved in cellulose biosynthesis
MTHEWLSAWWGAHASPGMELCILVARDESGIAGIAPLMIVRRRYLGVPLRTIEFISMSRYADDPGAVSGSLDWIVRREPVPVLAAFFDYLARLPWHAIRLHPLGADSPFLELTALEASHRGLAVRRRRVLENAVIDTGGGWERFFKSLTGDFRRTLRRRGEYFSTLGDAVFERIDGMETAGMFERLMAVERRSWKWRKGVSLNSAAYGDFYVSFARAAAARGWLRTWVLSLKGEDVAYELCVCFDGELHCLKKSYDARYADAFPGGLLERHIYEAAFSEGLRRIHTLWGDEAHKLLWRSVLEPHDELLITARGARSVVTVLLGERAQLAHRRLAEAAKRAFRIAGFHPRFSELTRMDQL